MSISIIQSDIKRISARSKTFLAVGLPFFVVALVLGSIGYRRYALWLATSNFSIDTESLLFFAFIALFLMSIGILFSATPDGIGYVPLSLAVIGIITSMLAIPFSDVKFYLARYFSDNRPGIIYLYYAILLAGPGIGFLISSGTLKLIQVQYESKLTFVLFPNKVEEIKTRLQLDKIIQSIEMSSVQLSDYLLIFPSACHHCGYRKFSTTKNYIGHRQTEYGETYDSIEESTYCVRCGSEQNSISDRVYSPYLNEQESDAIPDLPYKAP